MRHKHRVPVYLLKHTLVVSECPALEVARAAGIGCCLCEAYVVCPGWVEPVRGRFRLYAEPAAYRLRVLAIRK
ncbi:hypothetical protein GCM10011383_42010 [Hymenobacter cavernae]|uniref:Uncharacterized protein n=1 Tax=Hymenobacter cavernae TaxID=2044852 RepID=A0ABQ1USZ6_9BACT|nr:hypothetical protein GCM10011383_42010 [Hymenobacter cavernae]